MPLNYVKQFLFTKISQQFEMKLSKQEKNKVELICFSRNFYDILYENKKSYTKKSIQIVVVK